MPQLSPLPWLIFLLISFFPIIVVVMIGEMVFNKMGVFKSVEMLSMKMKW